MAGAIFIPTTFFHFVSIFLDVYNKKKPLIFFGYTLSAFFLLTDFTPLFITGVSKKPFFEYFETPGPMYHPFMIMFIAFTIYSHYLMFKGCRANIGTKRNQIKYVFVGTLIGFIGGSTSFFLVYNIPIPPIGDCLVTVYIIMVAIAILKYRLLDINIALTRAGIFVMVYFPVVFIPFWIAPRFIHTNLWWIPILLMGILATLGVFIYNHLRKRAENKLREEERRYQQAVTNLTKKISEIRELDKLLDEETSTITQEVKVAFCAMYLKSDEYKSFRLKSAYPAEARSRFLEFISCDDSLIAALNAQNKPLSGEEAGKQDKILLDSGLVVPCFGKDGLLSIIILGAKPNNQIYTNDDILTFKTLSYATSLAIESCTYWKELEEKHRQARMAEMDLFSYSVAHEIDNPMSIIKGNAEYLRRQFFKGISLNEEQQKDAEEVVTAILEAQTRVTGMVKAIEEFGKKTPAEMVPFKFSDVLEHYFNLYIPILKNHHIQLMKDLPGELPYVRGHLQELMQVLAIFSQNSIHALRSAPEKKVHVKVEIINSDWIRVSFSDTGYGIEKEKLSAIFSAFVTTKASSEGTGMGLYNAKRFILKHQGRIWAESEGKNKGATLIFEVPISQDVTEEEIKKSQEDKGNRKF